MRIVLVDERISEKIERSLLKAGLQPVRLPKDACLGEAVRSHPDTLLFHHEGQIITTADYCDGAAYIFSDIREYCPEVKISFTADLRGPKYPLDCSMNALVIGDKIFCNTMTVSDGIKEYARSSGLQLVHTSQGYPACVTLTFGGRAITSDEGIACRLREKGVETLLISQGHISLPPHEYGFIGGASLVYDNRVCFFGNIDLHPDAERIKAFIREADFDAISLSDEKLTDFGGGILL